MNTLKDIIRCAFLTCLLLTAIPAVAQEVVADSADVQEDELLEQLNDSVLDVTLQEDSVKLQRLQRDWSTWRPSPKRAMWLGLILPGAGQIYNRKYWKLPIIYGGMVGCVYAWQWNNTMYHDYSQAYMDITDDDPSTQSYNQFLHLGVKIDENNRTGWQDRFKKRKDYYRRYRDMSIFILIGVYALSVIDAYVDASLSEFDISDDLSLQVAPAVINSNTSTNPIKSSAVGVQCALHF